MAAAGGAAGPAVDAGRRELPRPLAAALFLVHALFAVTVVGGLGLLLTASAYDALDGGVLALTAYAAAPGVLGWWLARRTRHDGGPRVLAALAAVQGWLVLGAVANLAGGSLKGVVQLLLPVLVLCLLARRESRDWYRSAGSERAVRRPFSLRRMIRWGRRDEGQTAVEYAGLITVVAAIVLALVVSGLGAQILSGIQAEVCRVTGTACPAPGTDAGAGDVTAGGGTGDGAGGTGGDTGGDPGGPGDGDRDGGGTEDAPTGEPPTPTGPTDPTGPTAPLDPADPVAARDEIDEPPYEDPTTAAEDTEDTEDTEGTDTDGDGDGCFSGVGAFFGCAGDQLGQFGGGLFVDGVWGDLTGMWDVVTSPVETWNGLMDYGRSLGSDWWSDSAGARDQWDDGDHLGALLGWGGASLSTGGTVLYDAFIGDDVADQWNSGNGTRAVTTVLWNVGSLFIPGYGEAKIVEKVGTLGRLSRLTDNAAEAAQDARRAADAGDLDALEDAARRADEAADEAENAARRTGCPISAPPRRVPYGGGDGGVPRSGPGLLGGSGTGSTVLAGGPHVVLAAGGGCDEEAKEEARRAREHARAAYLERKRAEEPGRAEQALAQKKQWPGPRHGDTADPRNYNPPDWAADLRARTYGDADGGDGFWASRDRNPAPNWRNESWLRYQEQVTGTERGYEYVVPHTDPDVPDVEFDGWDSSRRTFLEAKNGYDSFLTADRTELTPSGRERLLAEARRQTEAARGHDVEWHFSNEEVADAARDAFEEAGLDIEVVHSAPEPVAGGRRPGAFD
ncbi:Tox-REase-5 domain-containing protein [Streptomyces sp. NPDC054826]